MAKNIGECVIVKSDGTRIVLPVHSDDGKIGYMRMDGKRVAVLNIGYVDDRKLKQLWKVQPAQGRPSQGRSARLQAQVTPDVMTWLQEQKRPDEKTISDVVFRLLEDLRNQKEF